MSDREIIYEALKQYEENNWESHDNDWQDQVNRLLKEYGKGE